MGNWAQEVVDTWLATRVAPGLVGIQRMSTSLVTFLAWDTSSGGHRSSVSASAVRNWANVVVLSRLAARIAPGLIGLTWMSASLITFHAWDAASTGGGSGLGLARLDDRMTDLL